MNNPPSERIDIPTDQLFLSNYYPWVQLQVNRHFKRDKDRAFDVAQDVRVRILTKNAISRWFFKHMTDELVYKEDAERILGGIELKWIGSVRPVYGDRSDRDIKEYPEKRSLWRVSDLLKYARFDYDRYYYSIQNHTIDSDRVLRLLGYKPGEYGILESLYRQGRLKPSEFTEHRCTEVFEQTSSVDGSCSTPGCTNEHLSRGYCSTCYRKARTQRCIDCDNGRESLHARGLSLTNRWSDSRVSGQASKLRWNDSQLRPFLREWRRTNMVRATPLHIIRHNKRPGIDAGLLTYMRIIIDNEVVNSFKRISRADDLSIGVFNNGVGGEYSNGEIVSYDGDKDSPEGAQMVLRDPASWRSFSDVENQIDLTSLLDRCRLDDVEASSLIDTDIHDTPIRDVADKFGITVSRAHRVRALALKKIRDNHVSSESIDRIVEEASVRFGCRTVDIFGTSLFGPPVRARADICSKLHNLGMSVDAIASRLGLPEDRVVAGIARASSLEPR